MSRRFGRNQKRRMREALLNAEVKANNFEQAWTREMALLVHQRKRIDKLAGILCDVKRVLESNSVALPPETVESHDLKSNFIHLGDRPRKKDIACEGSPILDENMEIHRLSIMMTHIKEDPIRTGKHVMVEFDGLQWGYAISRLAILTMPREDLARQIADALAVLIANHLKEAR